MYVVLIVTHIFVVINDKLKVMNLFMKLNMSQCYICIHKLGIIMFTIILCINRKPATVAQHVAHQLVIGGDKFESRLNIAS